MKRLLWPRLASLGLPAVLPMAVCAQTSAYYDPYRTGPTRPLDGTPRTYVPSPVPAARPAPPPIWSGLYLGLQTGYRWTSTSVDGFGLPTYTTGSAQLGGHLGSNVKFGKFVLGVEGDMMFGSATGTTTNFNASLLNKDSWTATARLRAGYAIGNVLFYGTGGVALAGRDLTVTSGNFVSRSATWQPGIVFGVGLDYKFSQQFSARIEALHFSYKDSQLTWNGSQSTIRQDSNAVRAGVTFHFN